MASERTGLGAAEGDPGPIKTTGSDDWRVAVTMRGELDAAVAPEMRAELARHLDASRRVFRIDVAGVTFTDSSALGELIFVGERCVSDRGSLILTNVPPKVRRIIDIAGLETLLLIDTAGKGNEEAAHPVIGNLNMDVEAMNFPFPHIPNRRCPSTPPPRHADSRQPQAAGQLGRDRRPVRRTSTPERDQLNGQTRITPGRSGR